MRRARWYRAECVLCGHVGRQRDLDSAWAEQERHADSRGHQQALIERDRPDARSAAEECNRRMGEINGRR